MNIGDMKYGFINANGEQQTAIIPAQVLKDGKRQGLTNKQAIQLYLFEQGLIAEKPEGVEVTKEGKAKNTSPKKGTRTRKPNETKQALITAVTNVLATEFGAVDVINPERQVRVIIDGTTYEFTLVQKRKS